MRAEELAALVGGELLRPGAGGQVRSVAVALDPPAAVGEDVLVLHRSHELGETPPALAVVGTHDWFDAQLPGRHAEALGLSDVRRLVEDDPRVLVGFRSVEPAPVTGSTDLVVVAGAMTDALVRAAAEAGARTYVTGARRKPAEEAVAETGIGVVALGHAGWEQQGLEALVRLLRASCGCPVRVAS